MCGAEKGQMKGEMDWSYLNGPRGTNESVWCMMGAGPIRQPITGFGLNGITNHEPRPASLFAISGKPQHTVSIFYPTASSRFPVCVFCLCVFNCVYFILAFPVPIDAFLYQYIYFRYPFVRFLMWEWFVSESSLPPPQRRAE